MKREGERKSEGENTTEEREVKHHEGRSVQRKAETMITGTSSTHNHNEKSKSTSHKTYSYKQRRKN